MGRLALDHGSRDQKKIVPPVFSHRAANAPFKLVGRFGDAGAAVSAATPMPAVKTSTALIANMLRKGTIIAASVFFPFVTTAERQIRRRTADDADDTDVKKRIFCPANIRHGARRGGAA